MNVVLVSVLLLTTGFSGSAYCLEQTIKWCSHSPDPVQWTADQVIHWAVWVMKEFSIEEMEVGSIHIPGRDLCVLSQDEFLARVPNGEILWSHLELLRKCKCHMSRACAKVRKSVCLSPRFSDFQFLWALYSPFAAQTTSVFVLVVVVMGMSI